MAKSKFKFPSEKNLKAARKKLEASKGTYLLPPDAAAVDRAKYDLCRKILIYMHTKGLSQRQLANAMGIPETRVSEIVHYRIWKFTIDRLLEYYERVNPKVDFNVA